MKTKYYKYTLQGAHSAEDAQRAIKDAGPEGLVVRLDNAGGQTTLYIAAQGQEDGAKAAKAAALVGVKYTEVSEKDVLKI